MLHNRGMRCAGGQRHERQGGRHNQGPLDENLHTLFSAENCLAFSPRPCCRLVQVLPIDRSKGWESPRMITIQAATEMTKAAAPVQTAAPVESVAAQADSESDIPSQPQPTAKPIPRIWIPAIFSIGLLIAAIYVGGRIVSAHAQVRPKAAHRAVAQVAPHPAIAPIPVAQPTPEATPEPKPALPVIAAQPEPAPVKSAIAENEQIPRIVPKAGERYIQVGALDLKLTLRYLPQLEQAKFVPHVAPGPTPDLLRVLIGPFSNRDSLNSVKAELDQAGIANFVRQY